MNDEKLEKCVRAAMHRQCMERGFTSPVDVLIDIGILTRENYWKWRCGKVSNLESVCGANLHKLGTLLHLMRSIAAQEELKPSITVYKRQGKKGGSAAGPLRFSKSGAPSLERWYATHFVDIGWRSRTGTN